MHCKKAGIEKKIPDIKPKKASFCTKKYVFFISSSIPSDTLRNYVLSSVSLKKKKHICISFALRGFVNGPGRLTPTIRWYLSFALKDKEEPISRSNQPLIYLNIDPEAARKAGVKAVPALWDSETGCIVYGDADLSYMIEQIKKGRCGESVGKRYEFAEEDAIKQIKDYLSGINIDAFKRREKERLLSELKKRYTNFACSGIPHAEKTRTYFTPAIYTLPFDIPDPAHPGKVLYPRGYTFNVLDYASFDGSFLIVDAARREELKRLPDLIKQAPKPVRVLLVGGDWIKIARQYEKRDDVFVFADCRVVQRLIDLYGLCAGGTPCLVWVNGKRFMVKEFGCSD